MIKVNLPDGRQITVDTDDPNAAAAAAKTFMANETPAAAAQPSFQDQLPQQDPAFTHLPTPAAEPQASILDQIGRGLQLGGQNIGQAAANIAGAPGDILNLFGDVGRSLGADVPRIPGSAEVERSFVDMLGAAGLGQGIIAEEDKTPAERIGGQATALGAEALLGSAGLAKAAASKGGREIFEEFLTPEIIEAAAKGNTTRLAIGDTATGAGFGTGMQASEELGIPQAATDVFGPAGGTIANLLAGLAGGVTGNIGARAGLSLKAATDAADRPRVPPVDPQTGREFGSAAEELAAFLMQRASDSPRRTASNIGRNARRDLESNPPDSPQRTAGELSDRDFGLAAFEKGLRSEQPGPFARRDAAISDQLSEEVRRIGPPGEGRAFTQEFEDRAAARRNKSEANVEAAASAEEAFAAERKAAGDDLAIEGSRGPGAAKAIDEIVSETTLTERNRKNELFSAPEIAGTNRSLGFLQEAADAELGSVTKGAKASKEAPTAFISRVKKLQDVDPDTGKLVGPGSVSVSDLQARRAELSSIQKDARVAGDFKLADSAGRLKAAIAKDFEALAAEGGPAGEAAQKALDNFSERFGPTFARGKGDAATEFRKAFNQDTTTRTGTPPSKTAERFISPASPERAESLKRVLDLSGDPAKGRTAARQFLLADMVSAGVVDAKTGAVNGVRLGKWRQKWGDATLDAAVPGFADEVASRVGKADTEAATAGGLKAETAAAVQAAKLDERAIKEGALGFALGRSPKNAVAKVFSGGDPAKNMKAVVDEIGDNAEAKTGLKQAIREFLVDRVTNTPKGTTELPPISLAKLDKLFETNKDTLAEVFSPKEMNSLRQVKKKLESEAFVKSIQAINGSNTAGLGQSTEQLKTAFEAALKLHFGVLKGGGIMRAVNLGVKSVQGDFRGEVTRLLTQAHLDPELAAHLLRRNIDPKSPAWNKRLQQLLLLNRATDLSGEDDQ